MTKRIKLYPCHKCGAEHPKKELIKTDVRMTYTNKKGELELNGPIEIRRYCPKCAVKIYLDQEAQRTKQP